MVRSYLRHGPTEAFGLVCSSGSNSLWSGELAYVPALEDVLVWNIGTGEMLTMWHDTGHRAEVTCIEKAPKSTLFAVGYADGSIRLWNSYNGEIVSTFNGHKRAVVALAFSSSGDLLASGSQDTDLIIWDTVGEAGLYRLCGHRDQITAIRFVSARTDASFTSKATYINHPGYILTASKDTLIKLWDLSSQHCLQTIIAHHSEVWSLDVAWEQSLLLSGGSDGELKAWQLDLTALNIRTEEAANAITFIATISLSSRHKVSQLLFHPSRPYLAVQSHDKSVEIFRVRTVDEIRKKQARRRRREREKAKLKQLEDESLLESHTNAETMAERASTDDQEKTMHLVDMFTPYVIVRSSLKVRSFAFAINDPDVNHTQILLATSSNTLELFEIPAPSKHKDEPSQPNQICLFDNPGHRTDIRSLCLSSDDEMLASASNGMLKIWNIKRTACIRSLECGYATCCSWLPGDRQLIVGTKTGELLHYDLSSPSKARTIQAHSGTIWSMHVQPDRKAVVTGGADKDIKFWELIPLTKEVSGSYYVPSEFTLQHVKTLKMSDDVLSVRFSPNGKFLAAALLDATVKIFYADSLKFFLSLYGHKLPVLSMDISDDSKILVTCSADKNVKIWGLDFGDCHKSIFAHDESIMQVAFERGSHHFWTVGKDKLVKYWDADKFVNIQTLEGHHAEVWTLAVSKSGSFVVSGSHDKSIRVWTKLDEPLFLAEERERELEQLYDRGIIQSFNRFDAAVGSGAGDNEERIDAPAEVQRVSKQTIATLTAGERIIEAIEIADSQRATQEAYVLALSNLTPEEAAKLSPPPKNPVLAAYEKEPDAYVYMVLDRIRASSLTDALLVLPFEKVLRLISYLNDFAGQGWNTQLISHVLNFLLKIHLNQILVQKSLKPTLLSLQASIYEKEEAERGIAAYNLAAVRFLHRQCMKERSQATSLLVIKNITSMSQRADVSKKRKLDLIEV